MTDGQYEHRGASPPKSKEKATYGGKQTLLIRKGIIRTCIMYIPLLSLQLDSKHDRSYLILQ